MAKGSGENRRRLEIVIPVFGRVQLDMDEENVLKLNPKFKLFPKVVFNLIKKQTGIANHKARWDKLSRLWDKDGNEIVEELVKKTPEEKLADENHREVWDPDKNEIDFGKIRASDVKNNSKVMLPKARNMKEEAELAARANMIEEAVLEHL